MTPAELKTMREFLGLTLGWVADRAGVALRTAQYWESGRQRVPADVAQMLTDLDGLVDAIIQPLAQSVTSLAPADRPAQIVLLRYRTDADLWDFRPDMAGLPASFHAAMLSRLQRLLWAAGVKTGIQYMEPVQYFDWLDGRADTESSRAEWAGLR